MALTRQQLLNDTRWVSGAKIEYVESHSGKIPRLVREFWTARQRQMHSLHYAVSYRASFKPELPEFFIDHYSEPGELVLDPFSGRGTTMLQANIMGRIGLNFDVNPLSEKISYPKTHPVTIENLENRLNGLNLTRRNRKRGEIDLSMFFHPETEIQLLNLRDHLKDNRDDTDRFLEMVALSRLHGHSKGFFSAYSFPQISILPLRQKKINETRGEGPENRDIVDLILRKAKTILKDGYHRDLRQVARFNEYHTGDVRKMTPLKTSSVDLVVTSPPFLDKADYLQDNWLEHWFLGIDIKGFETNLIQTPVLSEWRNFIGGALQEIHRVVKPGKFMAIEVGEVKSGGKIVNLEEEIIETIKINPQLKSGLKIETIFVNSQSFTKLAECFGVKNNSKGTNSNRILLLQKK